MIRTKNYYVLELQQIFDFFGNLLFAFDICLHGIYMYSKN